MAYFRCTAVSGGSGVGNTIVVTCDAEFAGATVTLSDGTTTQTKSCPSSSPYEVEFNGVEEGTWTVSATYDGETYTETVVVANKPVYLSAAFSWKDWVTAGGLDPDDYDDLDDVFDDEAAVRRLMTIHSSADYIITSTTDNLKALDKICENETAMKWLGQSDYICDQLEEITGAVAKLLASDYWERYLKDHVPTMTSTTAPYGTASAYQPFDGTSSSASGTTFSYRFNNPTCVKKFICSAEGEATLSGSYNGSTYTDISDPAENTDYYFYYKITFASSKEVSTLQFYGRSTSLMVPKMTSNSSPYGTVGGIHASDYYEWKAFNQLNATYNDDWYAGSDAWVSYQFMHRVVSPKVIYIQNRNNSTPYAFSTFKIQGYNESTEEWEEISGTLYTTSQAQAAVSFFNTITTDNKKGYRTIRLLSGNTSSNSSIGVLQFYCNDYSEKEFESNVNKLWLFDHGLDLVTLDETGTVTIGDEMITLSAANAQASKSVDLTNYSMIYVKVGDNMSGTTALIAGTTASANLAAGYSPFMNVLSVASVNQSLATGVKMTSAGTCDILELWLE